MGMTGGQRCLWTMVCWLHDLFCVTCPLHSNRGAREPSLGGVREQLRKGVYCTRGGGGATCWSDFRSDIPFDQ